METKSTNAYKISNYDLIIFDCDGTLVDSEPLSNGVLAEMMRELGAGVSDAEILERFAGTSFADIVAYLEKDLGLSVQIYFERVFRQRTEVAFRKALQTIPYIPEFINQIKKPVCLASNGPREKMLITLEVTDLLQYFSSDNMFSAYDINKWKPDPALYLHAANVMGTAIEKCLVIEDTMPGAMGAINAGMDVIVYCAESEKSVYTQSKIPTFSDYKILGNTFLNS